MRLVGQLPESMRMDQSLPFAAESLFFIGRQAGLFDLLGLKPQHILTPCAIDDVILQCV